MNGLLIAFVVAWVFVFALVLERLLDLGLPGFTHLNELLEALLPEAGEQP